MSKIIKEAAKGKITSMICLNEDFILEDLPVTASVVDSYHIEDDIPDVPYNKILTLEKSKPRKSISIENAITFEPPKLRGGQTGVNQDETKSMCNLMVPEPEVMT